MSTNNHKSISVQIQEINKLLRLKPNKVLDAQIEALFQERELLQQELDTLTESLHQKQKELVE